MGLNALRHNLSSYLKVGRGMDSILAYGNHLTH